MLFSLLRRFPCVTVADDEGTEYLHRYYIVKTRWFSVYVHQIKHDDEADMHDHPWPFLILILKQGYHEVMPGRIVRRKRFSLFGHLPCCRHRIVLIDGKPSWSLVVMGPKVREWGFWTETGFVHFKKYMNKRFKKGCE